MATYNPNFQRRPEPPQRLHPKKVRGGIKLTEGVGGAPSWATSWAAQRWIRIVESVDDGQNLVEGVQYAKMGQTKSLGVDASGITASVQGRADRPYAVRIAFDTFTDDQWHRVVKAMSEGAVYSAKLLSGELPANIEDIFGPLSLKLFPVEVSELKVTCSCRKAWAATPGAAPMNGDPAADTAVPAAPRESAEPLATEPQAASTPLPQAAPSDAASATPAPIPAPTPAPASLPPDESADRGERWCKHACCAAYLFAERLTTDPFLMFRVRGMAGAELLDRLRHMRSMGQQGSGLYVGRVAGVSDVESSPLDANLDQFWDAGPQLETLDMTIGMAPITHPLLRRLGPSPFNNSTFPLVGLLASCYDTISADVLKRAEELASAEDQAPEQLEGDDQSEASPEA